MLTDTAYNVTQGNSIKAALDSGAVIQAWSGTEPGTATATPAGTKLAEAPVSASQVTVSGTGAVVITGATDNAADATGVPTFVRIVDPQMNIQLTARMNANTGAGAKEVIITDQDDAAATQILINRKVSFTITLNPA